MSCPRLLFFTLFLMLSWPPRPWASDSPKSYRMEELVEKALASSQQLKLLDEDIERSRMELRNAKTSYFPHLTLQGSLGVDLLSLGSFEPKNNLGSDLILDWNFFQNGLVFYRVEQAKAQVELSAFQRNREALELAYRVKIAVIDWVELGAKVRLKRLDLRLTRKILEKNQFELKQGRLRRTDLFKTKLQVSEKLNELKRVRQDNRMAMRRLKENTGLLPEEELRIDLRGARQPLSLSKETSLKFALEHRTEVRDSEIQFQLSQKALRVAKLGRLPRLDLFAGNAFALDDFERSTDQFQFRTGVIARYPLYDGGQTRLQITLAEMACRKAQYQWDETKRKVLDEAEKAFDEWEYSRALLKSGRKQFRMMKREWDQSQLEFKQGNLSSLELDEARLAFEQARFFDLGLKGGVLRSEAALLKAIGITNRLDIEGMQDE